MRGARGTGQVNFITDRLPRPALGARSSPAAKPSTKVWSVVRSYANIADEIESAGFTKEQQADIKVRVEGYVRLREIVRKASGEFLDLKHYEADMRQLLDTYIEAKEPRKISPFNNLDLFDIVQHMKTKWGSCNPTRGNIRLNTQLAKKPRECLEYVLVHELIHLSEPRHGDRFVKLMDDALPEWRAVRDRLNDLPVRHEDWDY